MTHTPGLWKAQQVDVGIATITSVIMTNEDGLSFVNSLNNVAISREEAMDNARLIAASPDMLATLEMIANAKGVFAHELSGMAKEAIARAEDGDA